MATQRQTVVVELKEAPDHPVGSMTSGLIPLGPSSVGRLHRFFRQVPDADDLVMSWPVDGGTGHLQMEYFSFNGGGGSGAFSFEQQWCEDEENVWDFRVRLMLAMKEYGADQRLFVAEYALSADDPEPEIDPEGVMATVLRLTDWQLEKQNWVGREEMLRRRAKAEVGAMMPQQRFAVPAVYRN